MSTDRNACPAPSQPPSPNSTRYRQKWRPGMNAKLPTMAMPSIPLGTSAQNVDCWHGPVHDQNHFSRKACGSQRTIFEDYAK